MSNKQQLQNRVLTLQAVVVQHNEGGTSSIQLLDSDGVNGKANPTIYHIANLEDHVQSSTPYKQSPSRFALVASYWIRNIASDDHEDSYQYMVEDAILSLISNFGAFNISIRLIRPLSLGTSNDMHHLHIRQIQVFSKSGLLCPLKLHDASPCVKRGHRGWDPSLPSNGSGPNVCIDGNLNTLSHSDYSNRSESDKESHWMEFSIDNARCQWVESVHDIDYVLIYNRLGGCRGRTKGCNVILKNDDEEVGRWTLDKIRDVYRVRCSI